MDAIPCAGPEAFAELFARHDDDVLRVCRRILGSREAAEDARGEVFLRAAFAHEVDARMRLGGEPLARAMESLIDSGGRMAR